MSQISSSSGFIPANTSPELAGAIGVGVGIIAGGLLSKFLGPAVSKKSLPASTFKNRPAYRPGQRATLPSPTFGTNVEVFNPSELKSSYNLIISTVTPRPIALVSSHSKESGIDNVSPFSYFGAVAHDPPMVAIGFCRKGPNRDQKDSLCNILETKEFCVNIMSEWYLDNANHSCGNFQPDVDEFQESGMSKAPCAVVDVPRVKEAAVSYECRLEHCYPVKNDDGNPTTEIVLGRIIRIHVDREVLVPDFDPNKPVVDTLKLKPIGRLGGNIYSAIGDTVDIPRPKVS